MKNLIMLVAILLAGCGSDFFGPPTVAVLQGKSNFCKAHGMKPHLKYLYEVKTKVKYVSDVDCQDADGNLYQVSDREANSGTIVFH